ncbi:GNAT family N-acetyltransferase [Aquamicrobium sp.]|uniref:GNAT family N-acetyltransferase n=1 Tax=Aquamicrobium sp. TaxID=1872579 RepID=UPI00258E08A6|nr:GNAT family N-acetyltransferase [Aquamicrobium sp.]MCK9552213.1 GNAT family N-acetyltransferase [Aquamicrobium sp.]
MTGEIIVRPARPQNFSAMKAILRDTFESTWRPQITEASIRNYLDTDIGGRFVERAGADMLVAEIGGEIAGLIHCVDDFVDALHVSSAFQRRGVGRRLMERAEQDMVALGFRQARLETDTFNEQSQSFYKSLGYVEMGRYPDEEWMSGLTTVLFEKRL